VFEEFLPKKQRDDLSNFYTEKSKENEHNLREKVKAHL
jgi:hypothetical protein